MQFNSHKDLSGKHAFLSASKYSWIRYDEEKLDAVFRNHEAALQGSRLHEFAFQAIKLGIKLPRTRQTLNMYVNDALGFKMTPEQVLFYSNNIFGTADCLSFRKNMLRIHDLKSGTTKASMDQLLVYAALFCLEYDENPAKIDIELRIYQEDAVEVLVPMLEDITDIMAKVVAFDRRIEVLKLEGLS